MPAQIALGQVRATQKAPFSRATRRAGSVCARAAAVEDKVGENSTSGDKKKKPTEVADAADDFEDAYDVDTLSMEQVQELLRTVSEETNLAEVNLKLADIEIRFKRSTGALVPPPAPPPAPAAHLTPPGIPMSLDSVDTLPENLQTMESLQSIDDTAFSVVNVCTNKVGIFRRCRYLNTKQIGKSPIVSEGSIVKSKQPIAYIEQLGTYAPVEAPMDGEITKVLLEEGEPVEYDQPVFEMTPTMASSGSRIR